MKNKKAKALRWAFTHTLPVLAGFSVLGIAYGVLMCSHGFSPWLAILISAVVFAGSMQFVLVNLLIGAFNPVQAFLMTLMINARHLFYGVSMIDRYKGAGRYKPYLIFALTDETYSLLCDGRAPETGNPNLYRFLVSLFNQSYWVAGCVLGSLLGAVLPFSTAGIEFSMTALFIASFTEQWITRRDHLPALTGLLSTLGCLIVFGPGSFLIPAMLLITLVLTLLRRREEASV